MLLAGWVRWQAVAAPGRPGRREAFGIGAVAHVVDQRPGAVERRGPEIIGVPAHAVAGRIADAAIDAFDRRVRRAPGRAVGPDFFDRIVPGLRRRERPLRPPPLLEERPHVRGEAL